VSQTRRMERLLKGSIAQLRPNWLDSAIITEQVVDLMDPVQFPEMALARLRAAELREQGK
jgi:hypothetical protein